MFFLAFLFNLVVSAEPPSPDVSVKQTKILLQGLFGARLNQDDLNRAAIQGMLSRIDDLTGLMESKVLTAREKDEYLSYQMGMREGYGIFVRIMSRRGLVIDRVFVDGEAYQAGLLANDLIVAINDHPLTGRTASEMETILNQPHPEEVAFDIIRNDELLRIAVKHGEFKISNTSQTDDFIKVHFFGANAANNLSQAMQKHSNKRIIIDLRDNAGGLFEEAINAAGLFLEERTVIGYRRSPNGQEEEIVSGNDKVVFSTPIYLLVNGGTSGAAELFVAALQKNKTAIVVGETSSGNAGEANFYPLSDNLFIMLADTELLDPTKTTWNSIGIQPDVFVKAAVSFPSYEGRVIDIQLETALQLGRGKIP